MVYLAQVTVNLAVGESNLDGFANELGPRYSDTPLWTKKLMSLSFESLALVACPKLLIVRNYHLLLLLAC